MNHTIQLTPEQFKALQSGQSITIDPPKPEIKRWEPKGSSGIRLYSGYSEVPYFMSHKYAEDAIIKIIQYARQLAWLSENDDGWDANWSHSDQQYKYFVYYCINTKQYNFSFNDTYKQLSTIYMSKSNAIKLVDLLNSGQVEF